MAQFYFWRPISSDTKSTTFDPEKTGKMIHPATRIKYIDDTIGYGVFATEFIPKGTITWVRDTLDREISPSDFDELAEAVRETALTYSYRNSKGNYLLPWDHTRYVNHSFFANTMLTPYGFEIALCDIHPGDQITNDYGTLNIIESFEPNDEGHERKMVHPDDLIRFHEQYDIALKEAILKIEDHMQPLGDLLPQPTRETIHRIITGQEELVSILACYYQK